MNEAPDQAPVNMVHKLYMEGDKVTVSDNYTWGGGKFAGRRVVITHVQDDRAVHPDALIYEARIDADGGSSGIPLEPHDIAGFACTCKPGTGLLRHWGCRVHDSRYADDVEDCEVCRSYDMEDGS